MRLVVVSNRPPFVISRQEEVWRVNPGSGGLETALLPVLENRGGCVIGWTGALRRPAKEERERMRRLRRAVREYDIYRWVDEFLETAIAKDLANFPRREEYIPEPGSLQ